LTLRSSRRTIPEFEWAPPSTANGIVSYEIFATKNDAPIPALDKVVAAGDYMFTQ